MSSLLLQLTLNGLVAGSIYSLVASGFSLIYSTNRFMHFAHGVIVILAGYILFSFYSLIGFSFYYSVLSTLIYSSFIGFLINKTIYSPLQKKKTSSVILLIASISLLILFQNLIQLFFGAGVKDIDYIDIQKGLEFYEATITQLQIITIIISSILCVGLFIFMKKTSLGKEMRAVSNNKELADIVGINSSKVKDLSFFIGSFLAGLAGILISLEQNVSPSMGTNLIIKGFTGAVIGGISSVPASIFGSYIIGLVENLGIAFLPSGFKEAISFFLLFIFLLFRPEGLASLRRRVK
ncbi:MAG: branched-chain amino acid ABC transporter permease [Nanoarchaeota archaeon]